MTESKDTQAAVPRIPWPPLLLVALVATGAMAQRFVPLPGLPPLARPVGVVLLAGALTLELWAARRFLRAGTTVLPHRAPTALVTDGLHARSRHPIYVGHVALLTGVGLALGNLWIVGMVPILVVSLEALAIVPEERALEARFGEAFRAYKARTRRWL